MNAAIHQPNFLPWIGYFSKLTRCDTFVILDHVQFTKNSYQNRTKIKTSRGEHWLTVPVMSKGRFGQPTNEVEVNNATKWGRTLWQTLVANYAKAPFFHEYAGYFESLLTAPRKLLVELCEEAIRGIMEFLEIEVRTARSSGMALSRAGSDMILEICERIGADTYISGGGGRKYMDLDAFAREKIKVIFNPFQCPEYPQRIGAFIPNLSIVDMLFNCGPESAALIRRSGGA